MTVDRWSRFGGIVCPWNCRSQDVSKCMKLYTYNAAGCESVAHSWSVEIAGTKKYSPPRDVTKYSGASSPTVFGSGEPMIGSWPTDHRGKLITPLPPESLP